MIEPGSQTETVLARTNARDLYWSPSQQLAHANVNGASIAAGDLFASGTISGDARGTQGSLLELTRDGAHSISLDGGGQRTFLQDGDTIVMRGRAGPVSFGEVRNQVVPGVSPADVPAV